MKNTYLGYLLDLLRGNISADDYVYESSLLLIWLHDQGKADIPTLEAVIEGKVSLKEAYDKLGERYPDLASWFCDSEIIKTMGSDLIQKITKLLSELPNYPSASWFVEVWKITLEHASKKNQMVMLPTELAELMTELAFLSYEETQETSVYVPFPASTSLACLAKKHSKNVILEQQFRTPLIALASLLNGFESIFGDPLNDPSQVDTKGNELIQFSHVVMSPPFGFKQRDTVIDPYGRFTIPKASGDVMVIQHALSQSSGKLVTLCTSGLLFRAGSDRELRSSFINKGWLDIVIQLPAGLLTSTSIPVNILIFDKLRDTNSPVFFYDADQQEMLEKTESRTKRRQLIGWQKIVDVLKNKTNSKYGQLVTKEDIEQNDYNLSVRRYVLDPSARYINDLPKTKPLSEICMMIRSQILKEGGKGTTQIFREAGFRDISSSGLVSKPSKVINVSGKVLTRATQQRLLSGDILLSIKGNPGLVALVGKDCGDNWVAGQAFMVLRPHTKSIYPEYLYRYLASPVVQDYLDLRSSGSGIPVLKSDDLTNLPVPSPALKDQESVINTHQLISDRYEKISELEGDIHKMKQQHWSLGINEPD